MNAKKIKQVRYSEISTELLEMKNYGQKMRQEYLQNRQKWNSDVDKTNTKHLKKIIRNIGWPAILKVGRESYNAARLIVSK